MNVSLADSAPSPCSYDLIGWEEQMNQLYTYFYLLIFIPGLLLNTIALWVLCKYISKKTKAVIFMINLALADLAHVLSLPLRVYYYLNHTWPFGRSVCMLCFYLKYVNMYASIFFLVCVSVRRCELIMRPLRYSSSRRRGDLYVCGAGWVLVGLVCLPFPLLRSAGPQRHNLTAPAAPAQVCFAELPMVPVSAALGWSLMVGAELLGFVLPLVLVVACTCLTACSLRERDGVGAAAQDRGEKRRALRMVLSCAAVFLVCFAPYHITMPLDFLAKADRLGSCALRDLVLRTHPITLCLASLNSGLDPLMYYFTTEEFRRRLSRQEIPDSFSLAQRLSCSAGLGAKALPDR